MRFVLDQLDSTWKRVAAATLLSLAIVFSVQTFAASTYVQSQKLQQESAKGQHCQKWQVNEGKKVTCLQWRR